MTSTLSSESLTASRPNVTHAPTFTGVWSIDQEIKYTNTNIRQSTCGLYVDD